MSRNSVSRVAQSHFARIPAPSVPRSVFDRSCPIKGTINAQYIYPIFVEEVLPSDSIRMHASFLIRLATPEFPYMDNLVADVHFFEVPERLVWEHAEDFHTGGDDGLSSYLVPQLSAVTWSTGFAEDSIFDVMGLPTKVAPAGQPTMPSSLPLRAYYKVWNDFYRNQWLQAKLDFDVDDGPDTTSFALQKRNRRADYFTSCLPDPQKGQAATLPLGDSAPIKYLSNFGSGGAAADGKYVVANSLVSAGASEFHYGSTPNTDSGRVPDSSKFNLEADLNASTAITINDFRQAVTIQQFLELNARGGSRYIEWLYTHFGSVSPDFRLQRPTYLGGGSVYINVNPVAQTSASLTDENPQGNLAAFAVGRGTVSFLKSFVEHSIVLGLISIRSQTSYQQGIHRMWTRRTKYDYYDPIFANLGEQAVLSKEIYYAGDSNDELVFGYQERWAEYRYRPGQVFGAFRSNHSATLDSWHLALDFDSRPALSGLIVEDPPVDRIIAVSAASGPQFILDGYFDYKHVRAMPAYSVPGLDHI